jgi:hypothetical protein
MVQLRCPAREAQEALAAVPHKRFQDVLAGHWRVDADGAIDGRSVCWLYCWAKTGMGSLKAAEGARQAFDQVVDVDYSLFDARVDHEWAREKRYADAPIDAELQALLRG